MKLTSKAEVTIKNSMAVKRSERVLILCDKDSIDVAQVFFEAANRLARDVILMEIPMGKHHGDEPPRIAAGAMLDSDVIIAPTTYSITYTRATKNALYHGTRISTMPGITMKMLEFGGLDANYPKIAKRIRRFGKMFQRAKTLHITSELGTDLQASISGRGWVLDDNGICTRKNSITNLPAGEVFIAPKEGTGSGRLVIDGFFVEAHDGDVLVDVKEGVITDIKASKKASDILMGDRCSRTMGEIGIGMNPMSQIIGNILEDQKCLGTLHVGFGDNSTFGGSIECDMHYDAMILKPTLMIDRKLVIDRGEFVLKL